MKLRARNPQLAGWRGAARVISLSLVYLGLGAALVYLVGWVFHDVVLRNPAFAIGRIEIRTDGALPEATLRRWSGVAVGTNLLALDLERVRRDLELMPWVRSASLRRLPPDTLKIAVTERRAAAMVRLPYWGARDGRLRWAQYFVDPEGWVICRQDAAAETGPGPRHNRLPLLLGLDPRQVCPGSALEHRELQAGLRLITAFAASRMAGRASIESVDVSQPGVVLLSTAEGSRVRFGLEHFERQLRDWRAIHDFGQRQGSNILSLDLSITNYRAVVFWRANAARDIRPALRSSVENQRHV